jgi:hypothetical protein
MGSIPRLRLVQERPLSGGAKPRRGDWIASSSTPFDKKMAADADLISSKQAKSGQLVQHYS